ncbi:MAG: hypothetical protein Q8P18_15300 [Pseudomonadota bacterium]|nr:hypothetical protein [Pseudomonadota bacterium]
MIGESLFGLALCFSWANSAGHVLLADRPIYAASSHQIVRGVAARRIALFVLASLGFAGTLWVWMASGWPRLGAIAVLLVLLAVRQIEKRQWPAGMVVRLGKYVPAAACLLGWVTAATLVGALGYSEPASRAAGWEAAAGVMAALYPLAALSKIKLTGWRWMKPHHQALLIAERAYSGPRWVRALRRIAGRSPRFSAFVGTFGLLAEVACVLYVVPDLRVLLTATVIALHAGIGILLGYMEPEWLLVMVAITWITGAAG